MFGCGWQWHNILRWKWREWRSHQCQSVSTSAPGTHPQTPDDSTGCRPTTACQRTSTDRPLGSQPLTADHNIHHMHFSLPNKHHTHEIDTFCAELHFMSSYNAIQDNNYQTSRATNMHFNNTVQCAVTHSRLRHFWSNASHTYAWRRLWLIKVAAGSELGWSTGVTV